jgi:hypothetical protein
MEREKNNNHSPGIVIGRQDFVLTNQLAVFLIVITQWLLLFIWSQ